MQPRWPTVRAMTWNIHGAIGRNRRFDIARVIELIRGHEPDVLALQEIDSRRSRKDGGEDPFELIQRELGRHGVGAKSIVTEDGEYGQMLLSRWPIHDVEIHDISMPEREPRRAIRAAVDTPHGPLRVIATHLGLSWHERNAQVRTLLDLLGPNDAVTIVLGDFNDWLWAGSVRKVLTRILPGRTRHRTFPSLLPLLRLDRIYCRPGRALISSFVDPRARALSDHLPVVADLFVGTTEEGLVLGPAESAEGNRSPVAPV
jgi:endonuclease/exonuclease/phosphatase family metal-dependent hydrolase